MPKDRELKLTMFLLRATGIATGRNVTVAAPLVFAGKQREIAGADSRDRRKRPVKGGQGRKRAAYLDWAQKDRDSEGIHLVLLELVTGQSVISAVSAPRQRVSLCVPIIAPYSVPASPLRDFPHLRDRPFLGEIDRQETAEPLLGDVTRHVVNSVRYNELTRNDSSAVL